MTDTKGKPVDAFADINLGDFKRNVKTKEKSESKKEKDKIKKIAEENNFVSRQPVVVEQKEKVMTKTYSLFKSDCDIIKQVIRSYFDENDEDLSQPSGSDVVRAALHHFATLDFDKQLSLIEEHRGRGRK